MFFRHPVVIGYFENKIIKMQGLLLVDDKLVFTNNQKERKKKIAGQKRNSKGQIKEFCHILNTFPMCPFCR